MRKLTMRSFGTLLALAMFSFPAFAEENQSSEKVTMGKNNETDKADQVITNKRFRASTGSLSKYSINLGITYSGGSLDKPFAADRPNIANAGDTTSIAGLSGTINTSYRMSDLNRLNLGFGVQMLAPFHNSIDTTDANAKKEFDENQGDLDASNPAISFTHLNKFYGVQTVLTTGLTYITAGNLTDMGYDYAAEVGVNTMYDFGGSPFSIGLYSVYTRYFFDKDDENLRGSQNETVFGFMPQAEYVFNDTFNLRTIIRSHWYQNNRAESRSNYKKRPVTQSIGLGISLGRDFYLYPNVQFPYENLKVENTNVGITANINMF